MPNEAKYPSKERVERDGVLVHAEGDDLLNDPDEAKRQGYKVETDPTPKLATERIERDGVLVDAEGDPVPDVVKVDEPPADKPVTKKAVAKKSR